jgi:hypothetical protein
MQTSVDAANCTGFTKVEAYIQNIYTVVKDNFSCMQQIRCPSKYIKSEPISPLKKAESLYTTKT